MAAHEGMGAIVEQEGEIPMLTVVKNSAILKNIFLINAPNSHPQDSAKIPQDLDQTLLVGRHPNCQIRLEHPSISRFHLRIHTKPSLKRLSLTDLSSVHGTWISGKRVKPNVRVDVNEGDTLTIGKSSRVYRLHWIAFQKACGLIKQVNVLLVDDDKEKEEEVKLDGNILLLKNEAESTRSPKKASQVLISNPPENSKEEEDVHIMICKNGDGNALEIEGEYSADSTSKVKTSVTDQFATLAELEPYVALVSENEAAKPVESTSEASKSLPQSPIIRTLEERKVLSVAPPLLEAAVDFDMQLMNLALDGLIGDNPLLVELGAMNKQKDDRISESSTGFRSVIGQLEEDDEEYHQFVEDRGRSSQDTNIFSESEESPNGPALNCAKTSFIVDEASYRNEDQITSNDEEDDGTWSFWFLSSPETAPENNFINVDKETQGETEGEVERVERNFSENSTSSVKENLLWSFWSGNPGAESAYSSSFSEVESGNEDRLVDGGATIESIRRELFTNPEEEYLTPGKGSHHVSVRENYTHVSVDHSLSACSNKENQTPKELIEEQKKPTFGIAERRPLQTLFADSPQIQSITTSAYSNKENQQTKTSKKALSVYSSKGSQTHKNLSTQRLALQPLFCDSPQENVSAGAGCYSNNENLTPKPFQKRKLAKLAQTMPFQPLFVDPPQKMSDTIHESFNKHKYCEQRVKRWSMVVDVTCLLDKKSRKALQLLEGIKGTQLIVPLAVVRELEFMKQQAGLLRRNRDAYSASQWIEECSVRSKWWIQIQAQTHKEDEVVDYALYLKEIQNVEEEQLVILSDDVTMKIKAMGEGVICESADEFRSSLVSPFSRRFMWADSWPRGRTWSYLDDIVLRDHFYPYFKNTSAKGLKLALLNQLN